MKKLFTILILVISTTSIFAQSAENVPTPIVTDGLVAYLPFNGNGDDVSGNGNNVDANSLSFDTDRYKKEEMSLRLAGDAVDTGISDKGTISFWLRLDDKANMGILSAGQPSMENGGFELGTYDEKTLLPISTQINNSNYVRETKGIVFYTYSKNKSMTSKYPAVVVANEAIFDGKWHHLSIGWNGDTKLCIWLDGKAATGVLFAYHSTFGTGSVSETKKSPFVLPQKPNPGAATLLLGASRAEEPGFYNFKFSKLNGAIAELRVYSRVLKDNEIQVLYNQERPK